MGWAEHTAAALLLPAQLSTGSQPQARQRPKSLSRPLHCTWDTHTGRPPSWVVLKAEAYGRPRDLGAGQEGHGMRMRASVITASVLLLLLLQPLKRRLPHGANCVVCCISQPRRAAASRDAVSPSTPHLHATLASS